MCTEIAIYTQVTRVCANCRMRQPSKKRWLTHSHHSSSIPYMTHGMGARASVREILSLSLTDCHSLSLSLSLSRWLIESFTPNASCCYKTGSQLLIRLVFWFAFGRSPVWLDRESASFIPAFSRSLFLFFSHCPPICPDSPRVRAPFGDQKLMKQALNNESTACRTLTSWRAVSLSLSLGHENSWEDQKE